MSIPTRVGDRMLFIFTLAILIMCMLYLMGVASTLSCELKFCLYFHPTG